MARRNMKILLGISAWLLLLGRCPFVVAGRPARLASSIQTRLNQSSVGQSPAGSPPARFAGQSSYLLQPEDLKTWSVFPDPVPCETLVQYALAENREVQAARYYARALGARVPQAASLPDPQLMTTAFLESIQTAAGPQQAALDLSQRFPWFGKLDLRSQVAYYDAMAAYARLEALELGVIERVKRPYYQLYFLRHAIDVTLALEQPLKDVLEIARDKHRMAKAGLESVLQAQVELSDLKTRLIEFRQAKIDTQARLAEVLHLPPYTRIEPVPKFDRSKVIYTARLLVDLAESNQPALEARRREISRDRSSVALARRDYYPDVTVGLKWYEIGSRGLSPVATGEDAYSLGVGVNLPIYRKRLDAAVREAQYKTARSARLYAATLDQVRAEVYAIYAQFSQHQQVLKILESEIVPDAARTLELSIEAYRVDKLEFQQMIDNYDSLLKYRIEHYKREAQREQAIASLERAVGCVVTAGGVDAEDGAEAVLPPLPSPVPQPVPPRGPR